MNSTSENPIIDAWIFGAIDVLRYKGYSDKEIAYTILSLGTKFNTINKEKISEIMNYNFD